jgi:single-stranded-DNA-specific exonuclease
MGNNEEHLRLKLRQGDTVWDAVGFGLGNYLAEALSPIDVVYNLEMDQWRGKDRLRLNILDFTATNQPEV